MRIEVVRIVRHRSRRALLHEIEALQRDTLCVLVSLLACHCADQLVGVSAKGQRVLIYANYNNARVVYLLLLRLYLLTGNSKKLL